MEGTLIIWRAAKGGVDWKEFSMECFPRVTSCVYWFFHRWKIFRGKMEMETGWKKQHPRIPLKVNMFYSSTM
jgi:hypothetical protein